VGKILKWSWAFNCVVGVAALLLPPTAAPDSHLQAQAGSAASSAAAHVNFKIIVPPVLYLQVAGATERTADPRTVAIMSHNYMSAAARKILAQEAVCTPSASPHRAVGHGHGLVCTASIP
jgi:hypothetical protein